MDSRIDPLGMLGLSPGDAKIFRNPGGRVTQAALEALILGVHLLNVDRIVVVPHTRCAMTSSTQDELRDKISELSGQDARSEEHTSELQYLMRISYAVVCLKKKKNQKHHT